MTQITLEGKMDPSKWHLPAKARESKEERDAFDCARQMEERGTLGTFHASHPEKFALLVKMFKEDTLYGRVSAQFMPLFFAREFTQRYFDYFIVSVNRAEKGHVMGYTDLMHALTERLFESQRILTSYVCLFLDPQRVDQVVGFVGRTQGIRLGSRRRAGRRRH